LLHPRAEPPPQTENKTTAAAQRKFFNRSWRRIRNPKGRKAKERKGKRRRRKKKKKLWGWIPAHVISKESAEGQQQE
jgi:hypothetical protein